MTSCNGVTNTYDAIGNPLSYYNGIFGYTFTWTGRQLTGASLHGNTYSFTYNADGIRTSKTKNGVTTTYYLSGSQIVGEGNEAIDAAALAVMIFGKIIQNKKERRNRFGRDLHSFLLCPNEAGLSISIISGYQVFRTDRMQALRRRLR